jgi:metallo-beta-lactamase family protein
MKIHFHGAAGDVTGAAFQLTSERASVLVDCGLYQGSRQTTALNRKIPMLARRHVDAVLISHAHLDHIGRLPFLTKRGYTGPIFGTAPTFDLGRVIMRDAYRLQLGDLERENRRRKRTRQPLLEPLYSEEDVKRLGRLLRPVKYGAPVEVAPGVSARFVDAGHILGSASIELTVEENGGARTVVFSGDLGPRGAPLRPIRCPSSTRTSSSWSRRTATATTGRCTKRRSRHARSFERPSRPGPRFWYRSSRSAGPSCSCICWPAPSGARPCRASRSTSTARWRSRPPRSTDATQRSSTPRRGPCWSRATFAAASGSGMCAGGRIMHHLRHNLDRPETAVLIVGYQSPGSLGRRLVDGEKTVSIFGEKVAVRASIHTLGGFSAHAGQDELVQWFASMKAARPTLILAHGEDRARRALARRIEAEHGTRARCPDLGEVIEV